MLLIYEGILTPIQIGPLQARELAGLFKAVLADDKHLPGWKS